MVKYVCLASCLVLMLSSCFLRRSPLPPSPLPAPGSPVTQEPVVKPGPVDTAGKWIIERYARCLNVPEASITNLKLYAFIDKWRGTPYKYSGTNEKGIDCSAFIQRLLNDVYDLHLPRTSLQQFYTNKVEVFSTARYLSEGDLIFFKTVGNNVVSHVGLYLQNNMFIQSCSSKGVTISNLQDPPWRMYYVAAGRIKADLARIK